MWKQEHGPYNAPCTGLRKYPPSQNTLYMIGDLKTPESSIEFTTHNSTTIKINGPFERIDSENPAKWFLLQTSYPFQIITVTLQKPTPFCKINCNCAADTCGCSGDYCDLIFIWHLDFD